MLARRLALGALALLPLIGGGGYWYIQGRAAQLDLGVGFAARVACSCRYIGNRDLKSCYKDFEPGMEVIRLSDDPKTKTVTAYVPMVAKRSVTFDPLLGCQPEPFAGTPHKIH